METQQHVGVPFVDLAPVARADRRGDPRGHRRADRLGRVHERPAGGRVRSASSPRTAASLTASGSRAGSTRCGSRCSRPGSSRGDEVIVPANTFVATLRGGHAGRRRAGAGRRLGDRLQPRSGRGRGRGRRPGRRFLLPVHLYGQLADMRALLEVAARHGLVDRRGRLPGARRDARRPRRRHGRTRRRRSASIRARTSARSATPGALVTDDEELAERGAGAPRARPAREVPARARGLHRSPRHDPGDRAPPQAPAARRLERRASRAGAGSTTRRSPGSATSRSRP